MSGHWPGEDPFEPDDLAGANPPGDGLDPAGMDSYQYHGHHEDQGYEPYPPAQPDYGADQPGADVLPGPPSGDVAPWPEHPAGEPEHAEPEHAEPEHAEPERTEPEHAERGAEPDHTTESPGALLDPGQAGQLDRADTLPQHLDGSPFPAHLEVEVAPADGQPWVDPQLLGEPEPPGPQTEAAAVATAVDNLREAEGGDPAGSDDPAIRALARFWAAG